MSKNEVRYEPLSTATTNGAAPLGPPKFKWLRYEHYFYGIFAVGMVLFMCVDFAILMRSIFNEPLEVGKPQTEVIHGLAPGLFGIPRDNHDIQWRSWRSHFSLLLLVAAIHLTISHLIKKSIEDSPAKIPLLIYQIIVGIAFASFIFHTGILYYLLFTYATFVLIKVAYRWRLFPWLLWGFILATLGFNKAYEGYGFIFISQHLKFLHDSFKAAPVGWQLIFNLTTLKMISFGMDLHWSFHQTPLPAKNTDTLSYRHRQDTHQPIKNFNLLSYYAYLFYIPTFLAGPTTTFNAWISHIFIPQKTYTKRGVMIYAARFFGVFICFEIFLHTIYVNSIATDKANKRIWANYFEARHLLEMGLLELFFLWFKFLIIWRFARLWALVDGIETPENMNRCVVNNYSFESFWRSWHRSFNQWLIRYLFIPLGGSKTKLWNVWVIFTFVALWHDFSWDLVVWAWIICLTLMPEMAVKMYFHHPKRRHLWEHFWFKYLSAAVAGLIVFAMVLSNLIGYGTGIESLKLMLKKIIDNYEIGIVIYTPVTIISGVLFMFWMREREEAQGKGTGM